MGSCGGLWIVDCVDMDMQREYGRRQGVGVRVEASGREKTLV